MMHRLVPKYAYSDSIIIATTKKYPSIRSIASKSERTVLTAIQALGGFTTTTILGKYLKAPNKREIRDLEKAGLLRRTRYIYDSGDIIDIYELTERALAILDVPKHNYAITNIEDTLQRLALQFWIASNKYVSCPISTIFQGKNYPYLSTKYYFEHKEFTVLTIAAPKTKTFINEFLDSVEKIDRYIKKSTFQEKNVLCVMICDSSLHARAVHKLLVSSNEYKDLSVLFTTTRKLKDTTKPLNTLSKYEYMDGVLLRSQVLFNI